MVLPSFINFNLKSETIAKWAMVVLFFSLSTSRSLFAMSAFVMILGWFFSAQWRQKLNTLIEKPAALWITALVAWMYLSILWSEGTPDSIAYAAKVQWQLLLIPIIVTLANDDAWVDKCWKAFAIGMTVLILHIYLMQVVEIPWVHSNAPDSVFFNALPQSIALSIFSAYCLLEYFKNKLKKYTLIIIALFILSFFAIFVIGQQRLGYLSWLVGCTTVIFIKINPKQRWLVLPSILILFFCTIILNPKIQMRLEMAKQDIASYQFKNNYTSVGMRLHMWYTSLKSIQEAPIIGHGLGSYPIISSNNFQDPIMCEIACRHPHNQYIFYMLEFGLIGLGIFLTCITFLATKLLKNSTTNAVGIAAILVLLTISFGESSLWYRGFIYLFVPLISISCCNLSNFNLKNENL